MKNTLFRILSTEADATRAYDKYGNDALDYINNAIGDGEFNYSNDSAVGNVYTLIVGEDCTKFTPMNYDGSAIHYCTSDELEHIFVTGGNTSYVSGNYYEALINSTTNTLELGCKNTIIPSFVTSIGDHAFVNTGESITIPSSVTSIGDGAFGGGYSLSTINFGGTVSDWGNVTLGEDWKPSGITEVICSNGTVTL